MPKKNLPDLSPEQVVALQDNLLANADRLLTAALAILKQGSAGLARSLAILGMEESGKAITLHRRRVRMAYVPEGEPFVDDQLDVLWASHTKKLRLVHEFLVDEEYWFGTGPPEPGANLAYLGAIERWTKEHNTLKQRGFYVDLSDSGDVLTPADVADEESLADVIGHVHQIGWQLRLGEHIEAKRQAERELGHPPATDEDVESMRKALSWTEDNEFVDDLLAGMREGVQGEPLNNKAYLLTLPAPDSNPFENMGKPGYEAERRELIRLSEELDRREAGGEPDPETG